MEWSLLASIGKWLLKIASKKERTADEFQKMQSFYKEHIEFIKKDYEERIKYIESEKKKHPENGIDLNKWEDREKYFLEMTIKLNEENRDLKEELLFTKKMK